MPAPDLTEAKLTGARLKRAGLAGAHLARADLAGAIWPALPGPPTGPAEGIRPARLGALSSQVAIG